MVTDSNPLDFQTKICGITNRLDGQTAIELGVGAIGLNFYPRSLRSVNPGDARDLCLHFRQIGKPVALVGVFVNESPDKIREIVDLCQLDFIQLHGDEQPQIVQHLPASRIIRALRIPATPNGWEQSQGPWHEWLAAGVNQFLVDVATQGAYGGTGKQLDWASFGGNSTTRPGKLILAGGLNPDNVAAAIGLAQPHAVDVASGVEGLPGKKDPQLMAEFLKAANDAFTRLNPAHPKN